MLYSSPYIIRMIKSTWMRLARMGRRGMHMEYWLQSQKDSYHFEDQSMDVREVEWGCMG
jgi:hypothetical protein